MQIENQENNVIHTDSNFDINELIFIRDKVELMTKFNQVEVLKLLHNHSNVTLNENKYGIHINLSELSQNIITEIKIYINYVNMQENNLNTIEQQKESFKNIYFTKDNKDNTGKINKYTNANATAIY
jgi:hypothetical protein